MSVPQQGGGPIEHPHQLAAYLESGCKPKTEWRIGTEHEKFGFASETFAPLPYEGTPGIRVMLEGLRDRFGWQEVREGGAIIGLTKDGASVSLEPGGQLELSGAPLENLHQTCDEVNAHLEEVRQVASDIGAGFIGLGSAPTGSIDTTPMMPKGRYQIMRDYMPKVGTLGHEMMFRSTTIQVNLDFASEADMVKKLRVALSLQAIATALFASSPFTGGKPNGFKSYRGEIWRHVDLDRQGIPAFVFEESFGFERWVEYALDVPMYFVYRGGRYIDASGQSFRDFLEGRLPALPGEFPTLSDWADHLTTLFPDARIKTFMEMRGADGGPWRRICALPAFWVGLLYDETALDAAWDIGKDWSMEERLQLRNDVPRLALGAQIGGRSVRDIARELLAIADQGLKSRAAAGAIDTDESHFLNVLHEVVESGETLADELLRKYHSDWTRDINKLFLEYSY